MGLLLRPVEGVAAVREELLAEGLRGVGLASTRSGAGSDAWAVGVVKTRGAIGNEV